MGKEAEEAQVRGVREWRCGAEQGRINPNSSNITANHHDLSFNWFQVHLGLNCPPNATSEQSPFRNKVSERAEV